MVIIHEDSVCAVALFGLHIVERLAVGRRGFRHFQVGHELEMVVNQWPGGLCASTGRAHV